MRHMGSKEMYANSPSLSRGDDGKVGVHKKEQSEANSEDASAGHEGEPVHVKNEEHEEMMGRHNLDRHMLHAKHEHEHATHKGGDKKDMHKRHRAEHEEMLKKHDSEIGSGRKDAMTKGAEIENEGV